MGLNIYQVDSFADKPFRGNPAAVCILDRMREDRWLADVAAEMNLSETAFLLRQADSWRLRWFTPMVEVKLCGHATLASAHILYERGLLATDEQARFHTLSGLLTCKRDGQWIEMNFPTDHCEPADALPSLAKALGAQPTATFTVKGAMDGMWLVELANESTVFDLKPDFRKIEVLSHGCVIVTAQASSPNADFVSRFFAPRFGVDEDPVTGSAHCSLGPY